MCGASGAKLYVWSRGHSSLVLWLVDLMSVLAQDSWKCEKFSKVCFYSICEGGLVRVLGEAGGLGVDSGGGPVC